MSEIWIAVIVCIVVILSGALPLLRGADATSSARPCRHARTRCVTGAGRNPRGTGATKGMNMAKKKPHMSYEEHLDEVTTQITEIYTVEDDGAIRMVMGRTGRRIFQRPRRRPTICTLERAGVDAPVLFSRTTARRRAQVHQKWQPRQTEALPPTSSAVARQAGRARKRTARHASQRASISHPGNVHRHRLLFARFQTCNCAISVAVSMIAGQQEVPVPMNGSRVSRIPGDSDAGRSGISAKVSGRPVSASNRCERLDNARVQRFPALSTRKRSASCGRSCRERAFRLQRIVIVDDGEHAGAGRYFNSAQPIRVALAIEMLMVMSHERRDAGQASFIAP